MKIALPEFTCWLGRLVKKTGLKCYNAPSREYSTNGSHDYGSYCYTSAAFPTVTSTAAVTAPPTAPTTAKLLLVSMLLPVLLLRLLMAPLHSLLLLLLPSPATTGYCCECHHFYDFCWYYHCYHDSCYYRFYFYSYSFYCHSCFGCCCCDPRCYSYYYYCCPAILALLTVWLLTQYLIHLGFFLPCSSGSRYMFLFITWQQAHYKTKQKR